MMYHALHEGQVPAGEDPHYTLSRTTFERQMRQIAEAPGGCSMRDHLGDVSRARVVVTFDDGHVSNHAIALPILRAHGITADFFINPASVGRPGFLGWDQLREMSAAGMSIQSHGYDHVYLTRLDGRALRETLRAAREEIEQQVGTPVTLLAPPGGRMPADLLQVAHECGYSHVLSSRPGTFTDASVGTSRPLPRMAVTVATGDATYARWLAFDPVAITRERIRYATLATAKRLLGDRGYEQLRKSALTALGRAA